MPLLAPNNLARLIARKTERAQSDTLIKLDVPADIARLADDNARTVVDEEAGTDAGPGVDIDAGLGVGRFRHHARNQGHAQKQKLVCDAIDSNGLQAGIAENDLVIALGRRVALEGGLDVLLELAAKGRNAVEKLDRFLLGQGL